MLADERKALEYELLGKMFFEQKNTEMAKNYAQKVLTHDMQYIVMVVASVERLVG
jgi:hypothetical protein